MRKHLLIVCLAYFYFGFGAAAYLFGQDAGLSVMVRHIVWTSSIVFFFITAFTSMEKVKKILFKNDTKN